MNNGKKKILIVEDDGILRQVLIEIFGRAYHVVAAEDGVQAVEMVLQERPHLILLDLMLPKKDGFEVLADVRKNTDKAIAKIPVIVLSNLYSNADILKAENLIINAYFVKAHTNMEEVEKKVGEVLSA